MRGSLLDTIGINYQGASRIPRQDARHCGYLTVQLLIGNGCPRAGVQCPSEAIEIAQGPKPEGDIETVGCQG